MNSSNSRLDLNALKMSLQTKNELQKMFLQKQQQKKENWNKQKKLIFFLSYFHFIFKDQTLNIKF